MPAPTPHPPEKVYRQCDVVMLDGEPVPRTRQHPQRSVPSVAQKAWNLSRSVLDFIWQPGFVSPDEYKRRLAICDACEYRSGNGCRVCGCNLPIKARAKAWRCDLGKWDDRPPKPETLRLAQRIEQSKRRMLITFPHGFGDAVQLTTVLLHLRRLHTDWTFDVVCKRGADSLFGGLAERTFLLNVQDADKPEPSDYQVSRTLPWWEPDRCYDNSPGTKAEKSLRETFAIEPIEELCRYKVTPSEDDFARAEAFLDELPCTRRDDGRWPVVLLHYQGNSARSAKNLTDSIMSRVVERIIAAGLVPVVLDWEEPLRSALVDDERVFCPRLDHPIWKGLRTGDGATIAALIERSALMVGIDSGPEHVAGACSTPTLIVWRKHHPYHYYGLADNVTHLVPPKHERLLRGDAALGLEYFQRKYRYAIYRENLRRSLPDAVERMLAGEPISGQQP